MATASRITVKYFSALLDDIDKELNNYIMRCREWYGWHFPELTKIITDNLVYAKVVQALGERLAMSIHMLPFFLALKSEALQFSSI